MTESNQIVTIGKGLVDTAKSMKIDSSKFIDVDTSQTAIRYKCMAPVFIASRLKVMLADCKDPEEEKKLSVYIAELETAQQYGIDTGKSELIHWSSVQSNNTVRFAFSLSKFFLIILLKK